MLTPFNSNHESESSIQNAPELSINEQQLSPLSRNNNIVQDSRLTAATTRKTGVLTQFNGNRESESLIQNAPELFINDQHLVPISRNKNIDQASRLTVETSTKTGVLNHLNVNHESESLIQTASDLFIKEQQPTPLSRNNNIIQASRLAAEQSRKTGVLTQFNSNHESESSIQTAPELFINKQQLSPLSRNNNNIV